MKKVRLNLGSGHRLKKGFINVDVIPKEEVRSVPENTTYIRGDVRQLPFKENYADYVEMYTVIEHIPFREVVPTLTEIRRVMKKGAQLILVTDNFDSIMTKWMRMRMGEFRLDTYVEAMECVYGSQRYPGDEHKSAMTPEFLNWAIVTAGFTDGVFKLYKQNSPIPKIGTERAKPKRFFRTDMIVAEVVK